MPDRTASPTSTAAFRALPLLLGIALVLAFLYVASSVVIPLALAILVTFLLSPLVEWLERRGLRRVLSVGLVCTLAIGLVVALGYGVARQVGSLLDDYPRYEQNVAAKIVEYRERGRTGLFDKFESVSDRITRQLERKRLGDMTDDERELARAQPVRVVGEGRFGMAQLWSLAGPILEPLAIAGLVIVLVVFMLLNREDLRDRLISLVGADRLAGTTRALGEAGERVGRYLLMQLLINAAYGLAVGIGLTVIGVPYAPLWGFFAAILRYVPYLGPWLAAILPTCLAVLVSRDWSMALWTVGLFAALEALTNMFVEPLVYGRGLGVSQAALLLAVAFWTWLWGPAGLVLASPLTVCLVVLGRHVPQLAFLDTMLGDRPALTPAQRLYQRLLARDEDEASSLMGQQAAETSVAEAFDDTLMPVLALARQDLRNGRIDAATQLQVASYVGVLVEEAEVAAPEVDDGQRYVPIELLPLPARDAIDELALQMLGHIVDRNRIDWQPVPATRLGVELVGFVEQRQPDIVLIASIPPGGLAHTRYLCRRLRDAFPYLRIVVGRFGLFEQDLNDNVRQLREAGADAVVTRVAEVAAAIQKIARQDAVPGLGENA